MDNSSGESGSNMVAIVAIVILAGLAVLFFIYGLPMLQDNQEPAEIQVDITNPIDGGDGGTAK